MINDTLPTKNTRVWYKTACWILDNHQNRGGGENFWLQVGGKPILLGYIQEKVSSRNGKNLARDMSCCNFAHHPKCSTAVTRTYRSFHPLIPARAGRRYPSGYIQYCPSPPLPPHLWWNNCPPPPSTPSSFPKERGWLLMFQYRQGRVCGKFL